ncbi:AAA family ATPase [Methylobacterium sp. C33D]
MTNSKKRTPSSLLDHRRRAAPRTEEVELDYGLPEPEGEGDALGKPGDLLANASVGTILATAMLLDALTAPERRRLMRQQGLAMVVKVPGSDWMEHVGRSLSRVHTWSEIFRRAGASRSEKTDLGNDRTCDMLSSGRSVLGVSTAPERYLPSALLASADIRVDLRAPNAKVMTLVIDLVTGTRPRKLPPGLGHGLSLTELASCIRKGSSAAACVRRLKEAAASKVGGADQDLASVPLLSDCLGYGAAHAWGMQLVEAVRQYQRGERDWSTVEDRNIVLSGDPGVGKTSFARSLAKTAGIPLIATSVSSWFASTGGYLNDICKAVDAVFDQAIACGPCVLLLDEIDAVPSRAHCDSRHRDFWVPVVSHILLALSSAVSGPNSRIIVIGATNFPERLDEALVRPGRLNRVVHIERPDVLAIAGILRQHLGADLEGEDLMPLATIGAGATGADVAGWARGARMTARAAGRGMVLADLVEQLAPPETRSPAQLLAVARHEAGHAVSHLRLQLGEVLTVSLIERGSFSGRTIVHFRNSSAMDATELDNAVVSILAARAADERWGSVTTGSAGGPGSDLAHATRLVAGKHASYGLGASLLYRGEPTEALDQLRTDPAFRKVVDDDLTRLFDIARRFVEENHVLIDAVARRLVQARILSGADVAAIVAEPGNRAYARRRSSVNAGGARD